MCLKSLQNLTLIHLSSLIFSSQFSKSVTTDTFHTSSSRYPVQGYPLGSERPPTRHQLILCRLPSRKTQISTTYQLNDCKQPYQ